MRKYNASMLSKDNHLFQASITILDNGVKLRIPNFWKDQETFFNYNDISGVELTTPSWYAVLTYSTIKINLKGSWVQAHGFSKEDALTIKRLIDNGRKNKRNSSLNEFGEDTSKFSNSKMKNWINYQHDRQMRIDRDERISKKNEQNKGLIPKLKKIIIDYWVEILSYENNINLDRLSQMTPPPSNKNAVKELDGYIDKLKKLIYEINDEDYWEIEYKSINKEIWNEIHIILTSNNNENESFDVNNEPINIPEFNLPKFDFPELSNLIKLSDYLTDFTKYECRKIVRSYNQLDLDLLENIDEIEKNNILIRDFIRKIYNIEGRDGFHEILEYSFEDNKENLYIAELDDLFRIIKKIYALGINNKTDNENNRIFPFALDSSLMHRFLKNPKKSTGEKLSLVIDATNDLICSVVSYYNF